MSLGLLLAGESRAVGVILTLFGVVILTLVGGTAPERSRLVEAGGPLRGLEKVTGKGGGLSAIRFSVETDPRWFQYVAKAGRIADVWSALESADRSTIGVLFDPAGAHSPVGDERSFYTVYELRAGERTVRPYAEVAASWRRDEDVGRWLGWGTAIAGVILLVIYYGRRRS
jgi:hypothetical protein